MKIKKMPITLLEIMIVIFIIGIIGSVIGRNMKGSLDEGRSFKSEQSSKQIYDLLTLQIANGESFEKIIKSPKDCLSTSGFISNPEKLFKDGWNKEFVIQKKIDEEDFVVYSEKWETFLKGKKKFTNDKMKEDYPWAFYFEDKEKI